MARYFIEVVYKGTNYSGFQKQKNANSIQAEIEKAFQILHRDFVALTGSSRTDAGVHALQNFFHFDYEKSLNAHFVYKMNALLPLDIVIRNIFQMPSDAHSRFDATGREYKYYIHRFKDPFVHNASFYFPFNLDIELMCRASEFLKEQTNFFAFSKTNTQVKNFNCAIAKSIWIVEKNRLIYNIEGNRFLRGMVRAITATLLKIGRHKLSIEEFMELFNEKKKAGYSVPAHGLYLIKVSYPENYFQPSGVSFTAF